MPIPIYFGYKRLLAGEYRRQDIGKKDPIAVWIRQTVSRVQLSGSLFDHVLKATCGIIASILSGIY